MLSSLLIYRVAYRQHFSYTSKLSKLSRTSYVAFENRWLERQDEAEILHEREESEQGISLDLDTLDLRAHIVQL